MHDQMINLFVPDTFEGSCASILMHGYAKVLGFGITVSYYRGDCIKELRTLIDSIRIAEQEGIHLPNVRDIYILGDVQVTEKMIQMLADERHTLFIVGKNFFPYLYFHFLRRGPSPFLNWLNLPRVQNFFDSSVCGDKDNEPLLYDYFDLGADEFEQYISDYLHISEETE